MAVRMRDREFFEEDCCWSGMELCARVGAAGLGTEVNNERNNMIGECQGLWVSGSEVADVV